MKKAVTLISLIVFSMSLSACNTMRGFGKDVERGGEKVQDKAADVQNGK